ncbi:MAG: hypothetical protein WA435_09320 [Gallionellaceae bacterium]
MEQLEQRIAAVAEQANALLCALREKVAQINLDKEAVAIPSFESAEFMLERDPYNGQQTLVASFYLSPHYRAGFLLFHSDGNCFAEYHVMQLHPARPQWFIEAVEAWVRDGEVKTDTRLVAMPQ